MTIKSYVWVNSFGCWGLAIRILFTIICYLLVFLMYDMTLLLCHDCCQGKSVLSHAMSCCVHVCACLLSCFVCHVTPQVIWSGHGIKMPFSCGHFLFITCPVHCKPVDINKGGRGVSTSSHCTSMKPKYPWYKRWDTEPVTASLHSSDGAVDVRRRFPAHTSTPAQLWEWLSCQS